MVSASNLLSLALLYIFFLFAVAWYADRNSDRVAALRASRWGGVLYGLTLAVYCSSWTFYGAVGSATESAWSHAPIYLGPILVFLFGWPLIRRLLAVGARQRVTSIADFISARYGKRQSLAIIVTLVASAAVLPYIALQFKALAQAWSIVGGDLLTVEAIGGDTALLTAILLAVFTILFGTRSLDGRERHQGMMMAIAFESLVKLVAFIAVAVLALSYLYESPATAEPGQGSQALGEFSLSADFIARTLISGLAILCLPRQFHVMVVEVADNRRVDAARWFLPLYLAVFMILVVPISLAGSQIFAALPDTNPDTYVQLLPLALDSRLVTIAAFIGGISAATGMVIVATVSLAIMITNQIVAPMFLRFNEHSPTAILRLGENLRRIRQVTIVAIMLAAWLVTREIMGIPWLTQIGFISFLAAAQLAPSLIAGLYWRGAQGSAVTIGLLAGLALWAYSGLLPAVLPPESALIAMGPGGIDWLRPLNLLGIEASHRLAYATTWSLGVNVLLMILLSQLIAPSAADRRQAALFIDSEESPDSEQDAEFDQSLLRVSQLQALLTPFVTEQELGRMWREFEETNQARLLPGDRAPHFMVTQAESVLASTIGATSAHKVMEQLETGQQLAFSDIAGLVADASRLNTFNRELLQTTVESLIQGVSVVDSELRLVAWNSRYDQLFGYPERFLYVGCPIERVYRFNAERGILSPAGPVDEEIEKRLNLMRAGSSHRLERTLPNGKVIAIHGTPLPHGGFVTTYVDITDYREVVVQLEESRIELEARLESGSKSLSETNALLRQENRLRAEMEEQLREAHLSKSRFMSATSHDLLQPINAARLFTAALQNRLGSNPEESTVEIVEQIDGSLKRAEHLIDELREIARLDSGRQAPRPSHFELREMFHALRDEFLPRAQRNSVNLRIVAPDYWLLTDHGLLYRVLQNLLGNAVRYTGAGDVLLGARSRGDSILIQVWDTGPGIPQQDQVKIFEEFERGSTSEDSGDKGLGLGLSIVRRISELLALDLQMRSRVGRGTVFSILVPRGHAQPPSASADSDQGDLTGLSILCLDNDPMILRGLEEALESMGATVVTTSNRAELLQALEAQPATDVIIADYQLDDGDNGIAAVREALGSTGLVIPCIAISADNSERTRDEARAAGFRFMPKPLNAARLRALILALLKAPG